MLEELQVFDSNVQAKRFSIIHFFSMCYSATGELIGTNINSYSRFYCLPWKWKGGLLQSQKLSKFPCFAFLRLQIVTLQTLTFRRTIGEGLATLSLWLTLCTCNVKRHWLQTKEKLSLTSKFSSYQAKCTSLRFGTNKITWIVVYFGAYLLLSVHIYSIGKLASGYFYYSWLFNLAKRLCTNLWLIVLHLSYYYCRNCTLYSISILTASSWT